MRSICHDELIDRQIDRRGWVGFSLALGRGDVSRPSAGSFPCGRRPEVSGPTLRRVVEAVVDVLAVQPGDTLTPGPVMRELGLAVPALPIWYHRCSRFLGMPY